jgi:hypothetical protein
VRKLLLRDGSTCSNPCCRRRLGLHAHHIVFRSFGGRTALYNETMVCPLLCHALLHRGLLKLKGDPLKGLTWIPKVAELNLDQDLNHGMEKLATLPKVVVAESESARTQTVARATECTVVHSVEIDEGLVCALRSLGYNRDQARRRVERATVKLRSKSAQVTDEEILAEALRNGAVTAGGSRSSSAPGAPNPPQVRMAGREPRGVAG